MMTVTLAIREIKYRWGHFLLCLLSVSVAVATVLGVFVNLRTHERQTRLLLGQKQVDLDTRVTRINDDIQKAMAKLGFTITILPKAQNLSDWYGNDHATAWMPETVLEKLAQSPLATIEHVLPCLCQRIKWPEKKWTVLLVGQGRRVAQQAANPTRPGHDTPHFCCM